MADISNFQTFTIENQNKSLYIILFNFNPVTNRAMGGLCITSMADKLDKKSQRVLMQTPENQSQTEGLYMEVLLLKKY